MRLLQRVPFRPPTWADHLKLPPDGRVLLGHLPTPLAPWSCPALRHLDVEWWIKRDDLSGSELGGNKVRKLEFLLAEALAHGHDSVVTIGGLQSNHCRATAAAARLVGLEPHVTLLVGDSKRDADPGLDGNLMLSRMLGAQLHMCSASDYFRLGGNLKAMDELNERVADKLRSKGKNPYVVPVGGTCPKSAWGYIAAVGELIEQSEDVPFDHIVFAIGSGGTATGLSLGRRLAGLKARMHGVNVQHTPESYYELISQEATTLGAEPQEDSLAQDWLTIHDGSSIAYGGATDDLLMFIRDVAFQSGVILDHTYTGKGLYFFCKAAEASPEAFRGTRILFWHTGGLPGIYSQANRLLPILPAVGPLSLE